MVARTIAISGTPGVGKTSVALKLAETLKAKYVNLTDFVISNKLYTYYDEEGASYVIDEEALRKELRKLITRYDGYIIVDGHYGEVIDDDLLEKIIVLRLSPRELYKRLKERGWSGRKLTDNVESELLGICTSNALESHGVNKVCEVDATTKTSDDIVREILLIINGEAECRVFIDWLSDELVVDEIIKLLDIV